MSQNEDFVPDIPGATNFAEDTHDYTQDDVPFDNNADDETIDLGFSGGETADDLLKDTFRPIPDGVYPSLEIVRIERQPMKTEKVYLKLENGQVVPRSFDTMKVKVIFAIPGDEMCSVNDMFMLPPSNDPDGLEAYKFGHGDQKDAEKKTREQGGFWRKKLQYFLARLGFTPDVYGNPPPEAGRLGNWRFYPGTEVRRRIGFTVETRPAKDYKDSEGNLKKGKAWPQVKMMSYTIADTPPGVRIASAVKSSPASATAQPEAPASASKTTKGGKRSV